MKRLLLLWALAGIGCSAEPTPAEALKTRLERCVESGRVLFGHQDDLFYGHDWCGWRDGTEGSDVRAVAGDWPAVLGIEIGGIESGDSLSLDRVPFDLIRRGAADHHRRGGIVTVSWHPLNPATGGDSWDVAAAQGVVATTLPGGANHETMRLWLRRVGDFLASLTDDAGRPIPVVWRPWHESAGGWFWWGAPYCTPGEFRALWRMTYDYLAVERGFDQLLWALSPGFTEHNTTGYAEAYPGDDCVDLIGIDIYQYGTSDEFRTSARGQLAQVVALAAERGKLVALTETGSESIPDAAWWTGTLLPVLEGLPVAYVLTWRNAWDRPGHYYAPFPGEASADDFRAFARDARIGLLENLNESK